MKPLSRWPCLWRNMPGLSVGNGYYRLVISPLALQTSLYIFTSVEVILDWMKYYQSKFVNDKWTPSVQVVLVDENDNSFSRCGGIPARTVVNQQSIYSNMIVIMKMLQVAHQMEQKKRKAAIWFLKGWEKSWEAEIRSYVLRHMVKIRRTSFENTDR